MAINFSGYASNYAGGGSPGGTGSVESNAGGVLGTSLGLGIGAIPNFQERYQNYRKKDITKSTNPYLQAAMGMDSDGKAMDISDFTLLDADGNSTYKDAVRSFVDYKGALEAGTGGKGARFGKKAERKDLVNVKDYINSYNQEMSFVAPMVGEKIMAYARDNFKTDDDMKEWIRERGLGQFIHDNFKQDPNNPNQMNAKLKEWATPDETWKQYFNRKGNTLGIGGTLASAGFVGGFGVTGMSGGLGANRMYQRYKSPTGLTKNDFSALEKSAKKAGFGDLLVKKSEAAKTKKVGTAKSVLTKAKDKYAKAEKSYKGKRFASTTKGPNSASAIKKTIKGAEAGLKTANKTAVKTVKGMLNKAITKHGKGKVIRMVAKKLGMKGAISLLAKTGLAVVPTGLGNVVGGLLLANDIRMIYNILADLAD